MATTLSGAGARFLLSGTETTSIGAANRVMNMTSPAGAYQTTISNGTSSGQGNTMASITGTASSTGVSIDLQNLVAAGIDDPLTLVQIKAVIIQETSTSSGSNYLLVGHSSGTLTNAWTAPWTVATGQERIGSQGAWGQSNPLGFTVDATHKILWIQSSTGVVSYQIDLIGVN